MSTFERIESMNLGDRSIAAIRSAILTGRLAAGESIRDRQLAEELGVSRTPVRDALHRLETEGLVEPRGRSGWAVTDFTEQDVRELFQLRMLLEPVGIDALAASGDSQRLAELAGFFADFAHPIPLERHPEYFTRDDDFHKAIVACSGNQRIVDFYRVLNAHINRGRYILSGTRVDRLEDTLDEHGAIVEALIAGDFSGARSALVQHLRTGEELMIRELRLRHRDT